MGDEIVALNLDTGIYFSIRNLGVAAWRDLAAGFSVSVLAARLRAATGSDQAILGFVEQVVRHGLMRETPGRPVGGEPTIVDCLASGERELTLEVFEDMKDLILSDPIHDVDETVGWPSRPPA